ncbi:hypothetical protein SAMN04487785_11932 [Dyella jiangningensis]|nr:hypothetical protein BDW41_11932 [Dyella sp. AtDHG13]SDL39381.1 hypothetical protein SAMN04487785_11932 [Dyella jiangningensis]
MTPPRARPPFSPRSPSPAAYEKPETNVAALGMQLAGAWAEDAKRLQESLLGFFNRRMEKDIQSLCSLAQCPSPGALLDLMANAWGSLIVDYAEFVQSGLCWIGDSLQHNLDEMATAGGQAFPWQASVAWTPRAMT